MGRVFSIKRNGSNTYYIEYYHAGKQSREKVGCSKDGIKEKHAKKALEARMGEIAKGKFDIAQTKTYPFFNNLMQRYLEWSETHKRSHKRDLAGYNHLKPFFGNVRINDINSFLIERYKKARKDEIKAMSKNNGKADKDISFVSINRELALMKHFYTMAIKWSKLDRNPVLGVQMFPEHERERYLTKAEVASLLEACGRSRNTMLKTIVITALNSAGRLREILYLKVKNVDFINSKIYFEHTKNGDRGKVSISEHLKGILKEHLKDHEHEYVFCNNNGKPIDRITTSFNNAVKVAGIKDFRFHDLRHTCLSHLAMNGVQGRTLQEIGRFKTPKMVMRYTHLSDEHQKEAVDTLGNLFENKLVLSNILVQGSFQNNQQDA